MTPEEIAEQQRRNMAAAQANPVVQTHLGATGTPSTTGRSINVINPATNTLPPRSYNPVGANQAQAPLGSGRAPGAINQGSYDRHYKGPSSKNPMENITLTPEQRASYIRNGTVMDEGATQNTGLAGTTGTALALGGDVRMQDPNNPGEFVRVSSTDYLKAQQEEGTALGALYGNATNNQREDLLFNAGRPQLNRYNDAAMGATSGLMGEATMGAGMDQAGRTATVGGTNFDQATQAAQALTNRADMMGGDINNLRAAAAGTVPSAAAIQQRQGIGDAVNAQMAMAAGARGGNIGLAGQRAAAQGSSVMSRGLGDAAALRAQEQATARGQLTQAQSAQGSMYGTAGQVATGAGTARTQASDAATRGLLAGGSEILGSQFKGMDALGNVAGMEYDRTAAAVAQDQVDQEALQSYLFNLMNAGMGHQTSVYKTNMDAAAAKRGQDMQLGGAIAGGAASMLAGGMR